MSGLFAAVDHQGTIRFPGDVPRGAACGCFCAVCRSPLVAKQGALLAWHFAHEADQERPECPPGAANLLRRLVGELLASGDWVPQMPVYRQRIAIPSKFGVISEEFTAPTDCDGDFVPASQAVDAPDSHRKVVATVAMATGTVVDVVVALSTDPASRSSVDDPARGLLVVNLPDLPQLASLADAIDFIKRRASLDWLRLPDAFAMEEAARQRCTAKLQKAEADLTARRLQQSATEAPWRTAPSIVAPAPACAVPDSWPPNWSGRRSFSAWKFSDGSALLLYALTGNQGYALARLPDRPLTDATVMKSIGWPDANSMAMPVADMASTVIGLNALKGRLLTGGELSVLVAFMGSAVDL